MTFRVLSSLEWQVKFGKGRRVSKAAGAYLAAIMEYMSGGLVFLKYEFNGIFPQLNFLKSPAIAPVIWRRNDYDHDT